MELIVLYGVFAVIVGVVAGSWGRSGFLWFLLAVVISPLIAFIVLLIAGRPRDPDKPRPSTHFVCPDCGEYIRKEARVCKHCGAKLIPESEQPKTTSRSGGWNV